MWSEGPENGECDQGHASKDEEWEFGAVADNPNTRQEKDMGSSIFGAVVLRYRIDLEHRDTRSKPICNRHS